MSDIYVNYNGTNAVVDGLVQADKQIQGVLDNLQATIQPLQATWSGASDDEYTTVQNRWNNDMAQMQSMLTQYGQSVNEASNTYNSTDNRIAGNWASGA
jgi:WXG100 family type VII secretion target